MNTEDALIKIYTRNEFYRNKYYFALGLYCLSLLVIIILLSILVYLIRHPTRPLYFVADSVGRLIQEPPLQTPNMTTEEVTNWTIEAIQNANSFDFMNYRAQLQNAQKYFTEYGWKGYMKTLKASNNLIALTQRKMVAVAKVVGQPKLVVEGILGGAYAWKFEMPLLVTYMTPPYDDKSKFSNVLQVSVIVQRRNLLESYKGLGIVQMIETLVTSSESQELTTPNAETATQ